MLSNELFSHEPDGPNSEEYGIPGQRQRGIDLLAVIKPAGVDVAQCKCESSFSAAKVRNASDEFFVHWDYWKDKGVRRFVLFVACEVNQTQIQDELLKQRARFAKHGITYELWGAATLRNKLRPFRSIARAYFDSEEIVAMICGPAVESAATTMGMAVVVQRLGVMANELEELKGKELESLRELCRAGEQTQALEGIRKLKGMTAWPDHSGIFRARVLRLEAAIHLNLRQPAAAAAGLVEAARQLDPNGDYQTIDAYLTYCQRNAPAALEQLVDPKSPEARNFRWALLLESGRMATLEQEVTASAYPLDAETYRLLTLGALMAGDVPRAQVEIAKALELAPTRRNLRLAKATVAYFSALSSAAEGARRLSWPVPVSWIFVRRTTTAVEALREAAQEFAAGAEHRDCPPVERENLRNWQLACMACIDSRQAEAAELTQRLLTENPAAFGVMAWALIRGYTFDYTAAESALRERITREPDHLDPWFALWSLVWRANDPVRGEAVLDEAEEAFRRNQNADIWLFHKAQFVSRRDRARALTLCAEIISADLRESAEVAIQRLTASSARERKSLADGLATGLERTDNVRRLFECCEMKLRLGDFGFVARHAVKLVEGIGTASALRLAVEGAFKHGDHALCLTLLERYRSLFRDGTLSPDIRHLKAVCQHKLGDWTAAAQEAERIYREQPALSAFSVYFDLLVQSGDTRRASLLARDLLTLKGAKPVHWLRGASVARLHDLNLAKELWRRANQRPIKNHKLAGAALDLAFSLGVSDEAKELFTRLRRLARQGRGPLREQPMDEVFAFIRARREDRDRTDKLYEQGAVPIHLASEHNGTPLAVPFHAQLEANRRHGQLLRSPVLFARAGARPVEAIGSGSVLADLTSLLLAADIGLLSYVETAFAPIYLSPHATQSLAEQVTRLQPSQPDRQEARLKFRELLRDGRILAVEPVVTITVVVEELRQQLGSEHATLLEYAEKEKGVVLHDGPFLAEGAMGVPVMLPPPTAAYLRPVGALSESLQPTPQAAEIIAAGMAVLIPHSVVASLSPAQLDLAARHFRLMVTRGTAAQLDAEIAGFEQSQQWAAWTQALLDRLQRGIQTGTYRIVQTVPRAAAQLQAESGLSTRAMLDALAATGLPDGVTWCDDRMVNRHRRAGTRFVVSVAEILTTLQKRGALTPGEHFDFLLRLRQANVRYLPLAEGELEHHLALATFMDGHLVETPGMAILRRYLNGCFLDRERLQAPHTEANGNHDIREFEFPLGLHRAVDTAIQGAWKNTAASVEIRTARADWLLDNVYVDVLGIRQALAGPTTASEVADLVSASLGAMYGEGIALDFRKSGGDDTVSPRQGYFNWLEARLLEPLKAREASLVARVAKVIGSFIASSLGETSGGKEPKDRNLQCALWARFIHDLPMELSNELDLPAHVQAAVGMTVYGVSVKIGEHLYEAQAYWRAVADAVNGREGRVQARQEAHELTIRFLECDQAGHLIVEFHSDDPGECGRHTELPFPVLRDSVEERMQFMETRRYWFDAPRAHTDLDMRRIALLEAAADRFDALNSLRNDSAEFAYRRMGKLFSQPGGFSLSDLLLPSWSRLLGHLRFDADEKEDATVGLAAAAETLVAEEGLGAAIRRLICLPVPLPAGLEARWRGLPDEEAGGLFDELCRQPHSLVADLHLLGLAALREMPSWWSRAEGIATALLDPIASRPAFACFRATLKLVESEFHRWAGGRKLPVWMRLACIWYHASRLHGFLRAVGENPESLIGWLGDQTQTWTEETLLGDSAFALDLARANEVTHGSLVLHGLAWFGALGSEAAARLGTPSKLTAFLAADDNEGVTHLELSRRTDLWPDSLGSFLGQATVAQATVVFGPELGTKWFALPPDADLAARLEDLAKSPGDPIYWAMMLSVVGGVNFPPPMEARFLEILHTFSFAALAQRDAKMLTVALTFACGHAQANGDEKLIERLESLILGFARTLPPSDETDLSNLPPWLGLMNALLSLAIVPGDEDRSSRRFFDLLRRFIETQPAVTQKIYIAAAKWSRRLPLAQQVNLWPFILTARALR